MGVKRISVTIDPEQHDQLHDMGVNVSGLIRDLIQDYLSHNKIELSVSEEFKTIYNQVISQTGATDCQLEPYLMKALKLYIKEKIKTIQKLEKTLGKI